MEVTPTNTLSRGLKSGSMPGNSLDLALPMWAAQDCSSLAVELMRRKADSGHLDKVHGLGRL